MNTILLSFLLTAQKRKISAYIDYQINLKTHLRPPTRLAAGGSILSWRLYIRYARRTADADAQTKRTL